MVIMIYDSLQPQAADMQRRRRQQRRRCAAAATAAALPPRRRPRRVDAAALLLLATVAAVAAATMTTGAAAAATNLLSNPSLATATGVHAASGDARIKGQLPASWVDNSDWAADGVALTYSALTGGDAGAQCRSTDGCLRVAVNAGGGFAQLGQWVDLAPGKAYKLSVWLRAAAPSGGWGASGLQGLSVSLTLRQAPDPYASYGSADALVVNTSSTTSGGWTQLVVEVARVPAAPAGTSSSPCFFVLVVSGAAPGAGLLVDDAELAAVSGAAKVLTLAPPTATPIPLEYLCMHANHIHDGAYTWPTTLDGTFGTFRSWDSGVVWATIQQAGRGRFDWSQLDADVAAASSRGIKVLFTLGQTPTWASSRPAEPGFYGWLGSPAPPRNVSDWSAFVTALARRYAGRITHIEVWNEPDIGDPDGGFYSGTPEQLAALELAAADALAAAGLSGNVSLVTAALTGVAGGDGARWLDRYLAAGGASRPGTHVALHGYPDGSNPDPFQLPHQATFLKQLLASRGVPLADGRQLLLTEAGMWRDSPRYSAQHASACIAHLLLAAWPSGWSKMCVYAYDNGPYVDGLDQYDAATQTTDPSKLSPAGKTFKRVSGWLQGARMTQAYARADGVWVAALRRGAATKWVVWAPAAANRRVALPAAWGAASAVDAMTGAVTALATPTTPLLVRDVPKLVSAAA